MELCRWLSHPLAEQLEQSGIKFDIDMSKLDGKLKPKVETLKMSFLCSQLDRCGVDSGARLAVVDILALICDRLVSVELMPWDDLLDYADSGNSDAQVRTVSTCSRARR